MPTTGEPPAGRDLLDGMPEQEPPLYPTLPPSSVELEEPVKV